MKINKIITASTVIDINNPVNNDRSSVKKSLKTYSKPRQYQS